MSIIQIISLFMEVLTDVLGSHGVQRISDSGVKVSTIKVNEYTYIEAFHHPEHSIRILDVYTVQHDVTIGVVYMSADAHRHEVIELALNVAHMAHGDLVSDQVREWKSKATLSYAMSVINRES